MRQEQPNTNGFLGQLQSTTGERIEVWLRGLQLDFGFVDTSGSERKKLNNGISIPIDEIDNLQGLLLNARVRAGSFR